MNVCLYVGWIYGVILIIIMICNGNYDNNLNYWDIITYKNNIKLIVNGDGNNNYFQFSVKKISERKTQRNICLYKKNSSNFMLINDMDDSMSSTSLTTEIECNNDCDGLIKNTCNCNDIDIHMDKIYSKNKYTTCFHYSIQIYNDQCLYGVHDFMLFINDNCKKSYKKNKISNVYNK